jgi:hypothetical protein
MTPAEAAQHPLFNPDAYVSAGEDEAGLEDGSLS